MYTVFVKNVNAIDTSGLVKKTDYNNKITAIEGETPDMTSLATATAFNDVKNIANVSDIAKKTNYDAKISDVETKYFTSSDYDKFTNEIIDNKIKKKHLVKNLKFLDS